MPREALSRDQPPRGPGGQSGLPGACECASGVLGWAWGCQSGTLGSPVTIPGTTESAISSIAALNSIFRIIYFSVQGEATRRPGWAWHGTGQLSLHLASTPLGQCP